MTIALYLDHNGSTPLHPEVAEACRPFLDGLHANPSAAHPEGRRVRAEIERARETVAAAIGARPSEIRWTSGGTESNNWALLGSAAVARGRHLVVSAIEHKSVLAAARELERRGFELDLLPVDASGAVRLRDVEAALRADTFLVSVMSSNNETGIVQPVREIGELCRRRGIRFHVDAVSTLGKLPVDVGRAPCDLLSVASHKLYAPKGCGVLYVREGVEIAPMIHGCGQELGARSGTENALAIVGFARACDLLRRGALVDPHALERLRVALWRGIVDLYPESIRNGEGACLPNTLSVAFPDLSGADLQAELGRRGISVSAGASGSDGTPSHVLLAMGLGAERARSTLRFSLGAATNAGTIDAVLAALAEVLPARAGAR